MTNNHLIQSLCLLCLINNGLSFISSCSSYYTASRKVAIYFPEWHDRPPYPGLFFFTFHMGQGAIRHFSLLEGCIYTTPNNQAQSEKIQSISQMAPDAWHCVDGNSQMAEWIFHFPSGCVTWWRCSQSLEPKENASQGDEVLLLSRHLIPAGQYL